MALNFEKPEFPKEMHAMSRQMLISRFSDIEDGTIFLFKGGESACRNDTGKNNYHKYFVLCGYIIS